ncbi:hypothetical protein CTAYLR_000768 [Chrysophaeum taylorii]|uniref:Fe2OG dioxygenase domain-containing protein n=1 Tax=Chrysophaeum taylorii TaxID=2483200 RepID=A0AAD7XS76_9STRA|nr:hypothetical protein CTAYLR_000768 [Chrysophaeum taylorii]
MMDVAVMLAGVVSGLLLGRVPEALVHNEMRANERYHAREVVAASDAVWGRLAVGREDVTACRILPGLVDGDRCRLIIEEVRRTRPPPSTFTMSGRNVRETHVSDLPETKRWLRDELFPRLNTTCDALYDALVLRYNAEYSHSHAARAAQPVHRDDAVATINVALNDASEYAGGGTRFEADDTVVKLARAGDALLHPSHLRHAGAATTRGERWVLVAFMTRRALRDISDHARVFHARAFAARQRGDLDNALVLCRCALAVDSRDGELLVQAAKVSTDIADVRDGTLRYRALALLYAARATKVLPRSAAALHVFGLARLRTARRPANAARAVQALDRALGTEGLDAAQRAALRQTRDIAVRTVAFLENTRSR